ncbi:hypothetical protein [Methylovulum psychrotolerans]|uniref:DUF7847 domain-containing protein n=1 Tax=Methylovulum psychrotolerans TaxID=1704499 RepID=A0A2S5CR30_9GAMM|nr:hypothetical protein [Methylovulum psychrotolerans]POZ53263.1 hypothetical protein AADEFJLK_00281 [Methylovulum psychrotolerans]
MQILADEPVSLAKILDISIKLYVASFTKWISFSTVLGLLSLGFNWFIRQHTLPGMAGAAALAEVAPWFFGIMVAVVVCSAAGYAAIIYRLDNAAHQRQDSFMEALQLGIRKTPSIVLATFLYMLAVGIGMLLLLVPAGLLRLSLGVGTLLLLVPGIILSLSLLFYVNFIVLDAKRAYESLKASYALVKGNWWRTAGGLTVPTVLLSLFYFILMRSLGFIVKFAGIDGIAELIINLFSIASTPFFLTVIYVQFHDLKLRKSGADLAARLAG